jgi:hypothetical protein
LTVTNPDDLRPRVGDAVQLLTGTPLGRVTAVNDRAFRVESDSGLLTLDMDCFYSREGPAVTRLICDLLGLSNYVLEETQRDGLTERRRPA